MPVTFRAASSLLFACLLSVSASAQSASTARYEVRFDATWSNLTHPGAYPGGAHFSPLIGATHNAGAELWRAGQLATSGIEVMAETGGTGALTNEINALLGNGMAAAKLNGAGPNSPGMASFTFLITEDHPLVSLVSMIAPSPDWFIGVDSLSLMENGQWVDRTVQLLAWDAGTDSGTNFTSGNQNTNPADPIGLVTGGPFFGNDPLGTFTFMRLPLGTSYCGPAALNSTGAPGTLLALGSGLAGESVTLTANGLPTDQFGYLLVSSQTGSSMPMGSSGQLCLSGSIGRFNGQGQVLNSGTNGSFTLVADSANLPLNPNLSAQPGETWHFQAWYRDSGTSNFTDGLSLTFQ